VFAGVRARFINESLTSVKFGVCRRESSVYKRVIIFCEVVGFARVRAWCMNESLFFVKCWCLQD